MSHVIVHPDDGKNYIPVANPDGSLISGGSGGGNVNINQVGGASYALGQTTEANSMPVVLPSNQTVLVQDTASESSLSTIATNTTGIATAANQTNGNQQTKVTDGTNVANVIAADSGFSGVSTTGAVLTQSFASSGAGAQVLGPWKCAGFSSVEVTYSSIGAGATLTGQFAPAVGGTYINSTTFATIGGTNSNNALGVTTTNVYYSAIHGDYFQMNVTALTSGTIAGTVKFRMSPPSYGQQGVAASQVGTWTVGSSSATGSAVPANAFYAGISDGTNLRGILGAANALNSTGTGIPTANIVGQFDDVSPTAITENQFGNLRMSTNRNIYGTIRDAAGNERGANVTASNALVVDTSAVSPGLAPSSTALNTYSVHLTTNTTTTPTASTAYISSITVSNEVGGTTSTITIQDKQVTPLKLVNGIATTALTTAPTIMNFQTPVKMVSGIDIITAGAAAATVDVWINYFQ